MDDAISRRIEAMTGHTSDLLEALNQWDHERQATIEFFGVVMEQDELLTFLAHRMDELIPALRSRKGVNWDKIVEVVERLNKWKKGVVKTQIDKKEVVDAWEQLSFLTGKKE